MLDRFGIRAKLLLYLIIPLTTILMFASTSFVGRYADLSSARTSLSFIEVSISLAALGHQLQRERVASTRYSLIREPGYRVRLTEEYEATNHQIEVFSMQLDASSPEIPFWGLQKEFQVLVIGLESLEAARRAVLSDYVDASPYYSDVIVALVTIFRRQATFTNSVAMARAAEASTILLELVEKANLEQDQISKIIVRGRINSDEYQSISAFEADQLVLQQRFLDMADTKPKNDLRQILDVSAVPSLRDEAIRYAIEAATRSDMLVNLQNQVDNLVQQSAVKQPLWVDSGTWERIQEFDIGENTVELGKWLESSDNKIDLINDMQRQAQSRLHERFTEALSAARFALVSYLLVALACLLSSVLIGYLLVARFVTSLIHIEEKLNEMKSSDDLDIQIALPGKDEIGEMATAFDRLLRRRKFLEQERASLQDELFKVQEAQNRVLEERVNQRTRELNLALKKAEAANEAKRVFLGNISHHVRTPLNSILGNAQLLLKEDVLAPDEQRRISNISDQGNELLVLMNDVLEIVNVEDNDFHFERTEFDINQLLNQLQREFTNQAAENGIYFDFDIAHSLSPIFRADEQKLYRILGCLVGNAIQHSGSEFVTVKIGQVESQDDLTGNEWVAVSIEIVDNGLGIPAKNIDSVQDPFEQVTPGCDSAGGGLGLGLSIASKFVSGLGGELLIRSKAGRGTRVTVTLPGIATIRTDQEMGAAENMVSGRTKIVTANEDEISVERLQAIDPSSWALMLQALDCADFLAIQKALKLISEDDDRVGEAIRRLVDLFDYDGIRQLIPVPKAGLSLAL